MRRGRARWCGDRFGPRSRACAARTAGRRQPLIRRRAAAPASRWPRPRLCCYPSKIAGPSTNRPRSERGRGSDAQMIRAPTALALGRIGVAGCPAAHPSAPGRLSPNAARPPNSVRALSDAPRIELAMSSRTPTEVFAAGAWAARCLDRKREPGTRCWGRSGADRSASRFLRALWRIRRRGSRGVGSFRPVRMIPTFFRAGALYARRGRPRNLRLILPRRFRSDAEKAVWRRGPRDPGMCRVVDSSPPPRGGGSSTISAMGALKAVLENHPEATLPENRRDRVLALSGDANPNLAVPALALLRWLAADREAFRRLWQTASAGSGRRQQVALQSLMAGLQDGRSRSRTRIDSVEPTSPGAAAEACVYAAGRKRQRGGGAALPIPRSSLGSSYRGAEARKKCARTRPLKFYDYYRKRIGIRAPRGGVGTLSSSPESVRRWRWWGGSKKSAGDGTPESRDRGRSPTAERQPSRPEPRDLVEAASRHPSTLVPDGAALPVRHPRARRSFPGESYVTGKSIATRPRPGVERWRRGRQDSETRAASFPLRSREKSAMTVRNFADADAGGYFDSGSSSASCERCRPGRRPTGTGKGAPRYEIATRST